MHPETVWMALGEMTHGADAVTPCGEEELGLPVLGDLVGPRQPSGESRRLRSDPRQVASGADVFEFVDECAAITVVQIVEHPRVGDHRVTERADALNGLGHFSHKVALQNAGRVDSGQINSGAETTETFGLIRPDASLEPTCLPVVGDINWTSRRYRAVPAIVGSMAGIGTAPRVEAVRVTVEAGPTVDAGDPSSGSYRYANWSSKRFNPAARTDINHRHGPNLLGNHAERWQEQQRTADLIRLG